jgi:hypothetical protein
VFFHRETELRLGVAGDELVVRHARVLERASARLRAGQPFLVGPDGTVDVRVNRWFVSDEVRGLSRSTWEKYAYSLKVWLSFLCAYACRWDEADASAQEAFKVWRVQDERNARLVSLGTYDDDLIAMRLFYAWASAEYGVHNPIRMRRSRGRRRRDGSLAERAVAAPKATRARDVKWLDPDGFARYRDVGLMGLTVGGEDDPGFRGVIANAKARSLTVFMAPVSVCGNGRRCCRSNCLRMIPPGAITPAGWLTRRRKVDTVGSIGCPGTLCCRR